MPDRTAGQLFVQNPLLQSKYHRIYHEIAEREDLNHGAKLVHAVLVSYASRFRNVFPGQIRLANDIGSTTRSVIRYMQELEEAGLLHVERRRGGLTNVYTLLDWTQEGLSEVSDNLSLTESTLSHSPVESVTYSKKNEEQEGKRESTGEQRVDTAAGIWERVLNDLRGTMSRANFDAWFSDIQAVSFESGELVVSVQNPLIRDTLEARFRQHILRALYDVVGRQCRLRFT